jgi:hypothetical protein
MKNKILYWPEIKCSQCGTDIKVPIMTDKYFTEEKIKKVFDSESFLCIECSNEKIFKDTLDRCYNEIIELVRIDLNGKLDQK